MKTVLFYTSNGIGLGHLQRTRLIAEQLRRENIKIVLVTSVLSPEIFGRFFHHLIRLTPMSDRLFGQPEGVREARLANARKFIQALREFRSDVIVADFFLRSEFSFYPFQCAFYPFQYAREQRHPIRKIFIWRLGDKEISRQYLEGERDRRLEYFHKIILPHNQGELENLLSPESLKRVKTDAKFQICGPVFKKLDKSKLIICQKKYEISPKDFLILVTFGGGGASGISEAGSPSKILEYIVSIYSQLMQINPNLKVIVIPGPYYKNSVGSFFGISKEIRIVEFEEYLPELVHLSHLVISTAGYNICNEIIEAETPAILVPLLRGDSEQFKRAEGLEKKGIAKIWRGDSFSQFLDLMIDCQKNLDTMKLNFKKIPKIDSGDGLAAKIILDFLNEEPIIKPPMHP